MMFEIHLCLLSGAKVCIFQITGKKTYGKRVVLQWKSENMNRNVAKLVQFVLLFAGT